MGVFDEPEKVRAKGRQAASCRSWPLSARLVVGALLVVNIFLAAFLVRTEIEGFGARAISNPLKLQRQMPGSTLQLKAPPEKGASLGQGSRLDQGRGPKVPSVEARSAGLPSAQMAKRAENRTLRASKKTRAVLSARLPLAVNYPPHESLVRTPPPVPNPAASSSASANIQYRGRAPSFGISGQGVHSGAGPHPIAPAASARATSVIDYALNARGTRSGAVATVALIGLPAMEKGLVASKRPVAPAGVKVQIIPRPAEKVENCGDDKLFVACPKLKIRYDTPYTTQVP